MNIQQTTVQQVNLFSPLTNKDVVSVVTPAWSIGPCGTKAPADTRQQTHKHFMFIFIIAYIWNPQISVHNKAPVVSIGTKGAVDSRWDVFGL